MPPYASCPPARLCGVRQGRPERRHARAACLIVSLFDSGDHQDICMISLESSCDKFSHMITEWANLFEFSQITVIPMEPSRRSTYASDSQPPVPSRRGSPVDADRCLRRLLLNCRGLHQFARLFRGRGSEGAVGAVGLQHYASGFDRPCTVLSQRPIKAEDPVTCFAGFRRRSGLAGVRLRSLGASAPSHVAARHCRSRRVAGGPGRCQRPPPLPASRPALSLQRCR